MLFKLYIGPAILFTAVVTIVVGGCATTYQSVAFTGGYEETRLDENVFSIFFRGNGFTSSQRAQDFTFLRSSELTLQYGYVLCYRAI